MRARAFILLTVAIGALLLVESSCAQQTTSGAPVDKGGYRELSLFEGSTTIQTRSGPKRVRIVLSKLEIESGGRSARIELPPRGTAMFQHRAGELLATVDNERFSPLEGEWLTIDLPATLVFVTEDDSVIVDLILIDEEQ